MIDHLLSSCLLGLRSWNLRLEVLGLLWVDWSRALNPQFPDGWILELVKNSLGWVTNSGFCKTKSKASLILGFLMLKVSEYLIGSVWISTRILRLGSEWDYEILKRKCN